MAFNLEHTAKFEKADNLRKANRDSFLKQEINILGKPFSNKIKEDFYTELGVLLKAGITLKDAIELLHKAQNKKQNKQILHDILQTIINGESLSEVLKQQKYFSEYEYFSIKIGEETGTLSKVMLQLGTFFSRKNEQRRNIISALTYPIIILSTAVLVVGFMLRYVVPMFQDIFKQQNVELPAITKVIIRLSDFIQTYGGLLLLFVVILFVLKRFANKNVRFKQFGDTLILKLPFIGKFVRNVYLSQFTQAVALLTASKVPIVNSIQLVKQMIGFYPLKQSLNIVESYILKGASLSESLKQHKFFDSKMVALVKVAEETNQTEFIFERLNQQYNIQVQQQSKMLSTIIEPFIILIVGFFVGIILVAMYLPMFKLSSAIG